MYLSPHWSRQCVGLGRSWPSDESVLTLRIATFCFPEQLDVVMLSIRCSCCSLLVVYLPLLDYTLACVQLMFLWSYGGPKRLAGIVAVLAAIYSKPDVSF